MSKCTPSSLPSFCIQVHSHYPGALRSPGALLSHAALCTQVQYKGYGALHVNVHNYVLSNSCTTPLSSQPVRRSPPDPASELQPSQLQTPGRWQHHPVPTLCTNRQRCTHSATTERGCPVHWLVQGTLVHSS